MSYGFITVVSVPELGYSGGLLILRGDGKPIEFHCTAPIAENRAQKILYGSTYEQFVFCDQIGTSLFAKATTKPKIVVTDQLDLMQLSESISQPVVHVNVAGAKGDELTNRENRQLQNDNPNQSFVIGDHELTFSCVALQICQDTKIACQQFAANLPLDEPFERIRQAIDEAQAVAR